MKCTHIALAILAASAGCAALWAQRTGDFGFGNDDSPTNVKAEFYWSRLAYSTNIASNFGGYGHRWRSSWSRDYPKARSEEHTSELQSRLHLVCRLLLEKKKRDASSQENQDARRRQRARLASHVCCV